VVVLLQRCVRRPGVDADHATRAPGAQHRGDGEQRPPSVDADLDRVPHAEGGDEVGEHERLPQPGAAAEVEGHGADDRREGLAQLGGELPAVPRLAHAPAVLATTA
jgi:hypothetical protein